VIGRLRGTVVVKRPPYLILEVGGVGYEIEAPMSTFYALPESGEVILHTHLTVRDDALQLFGFASTAEKTLFRDLIKVSGVGGKMALTILSGISVPDFIATVREGDDSRLTGLPGVGKKTAARLVVEMRDQLGEAVSGEAGESTAPSQTVGSNRAEAFDALTTLGYKPAEANRLLKDLGDAGTDSEELIRLALKRAVR